MSYLMSPVHACKVFSDYFFNYFDFQMLYTVRRGDIERTQLLNSRKDEERHCGFSSFSNFLSKNGSSDARRQSDADICCLSDQCPERL